MQQWIRVFDGAKTGKAHVFKPGPNRIGSAKDAEILVRGPDIAPEHAVVELLPDGRLVLRNRSTTGTRVGGRPITLCELKSGDTVQLGSSVAMQVGAGDVTSEAPPTMKAGSAKSGRKPITGKQIAIAVALAVYLGGILAFVISREMGPEKGSPAVVAAAEARALRDTRDQLLSGEVRTGSATVVSSLSTGDPSAAYHAFLAAKGRSAAEKELEQALQGLLDPVETALRDARILEQQGRFIEARQRYRYVLDAVPDARLPIVRYATGRLAEIRRELPADD